MGNWSSSYYQNQLKAVSDPASGIQIDEMVQTAIGEDPLDTTQKYEDVVRKAAVQWLGPGFGGWDDALVEEWAGKLRNDPDAIHALEESLKDQKQGLFSGYDREMSYNAIVSPWREFMRNQWGTTPDEDYPLILMTGRTLYHYNVGTMTRQSAASNERQPECFVEVSEEDAAGLGVATGDKVTVSTRRGQIVVTA